MIYFRGLQRLAFNALHASDGAPDALRSLKHGRRIHQCFNLTCFRIL